jgi:hypothetical protein
MAQAEYSMVPVGATTPLIIHYTPTQPVQRYKSFYWGMYTIIICFSFALLIYLVIRYLL